MTSPLPLHRAPSAGFDEPFEMLAACHERVERMLALLARLQAHLPAHGADAAARSAARDVIRYFDLAGPAHHEDEERHVLPPLQALGERALAAQLHADHVAMARHWQALREPLAAVADGRWSGAAADGGFATWERFAALYRTHMALEDRRAYPLVQAHADAAAQRAMGQEMAQRRGVPAPR